MTYQLLQGDTAVLGKLCTRDADRARTLFAQTRRELGAGRSPAFEGLLEHAHARSEMPPDIVAEIVLMLQPICIAQTMSARTSRGKKLWSALHWLPEATLVPVYHKFQQESHTRDWQSTALVTHPNAGRTIWRLALSTERVPTEVIKAVITTASARGDETFLREVVRTGDCLL